MAGITVVRVKPHLLKISFTRLRSRSFSRSFSFHSSRAKTFFISSSTFSRGLSLTSGCSLSSLAISSFAAISALRLTISAWFWAISSCLGAIYYVAIATVIFSHVKITCYFHVWRYHFFGRKLTWYFIGVYIIKNIFSVFSHVRSRNKNGNLSIQKA